MTATLPRPYLTSDKGTFGEFTANTRWAIILQNAVEDTEYSMKHDKQDIDAGKDILINLKAFKKEVEDNDKLRPFTQDEMKIANVPLSFNEFLENEGSKETWFNSSWLFAEIYLYRRVNVAFAMNAKKHGSKFWAEFDIFNRLKQETFQLSQYGVTELAIRYVNLNKHLQTDIDVETKQILFKEFLEISLWGNATDLSLLTNATLDDIKSVQGAKAREESESRILINHTKNAFDLLEKTAPNNRIDIVLDNSGFELYADFMLALFLIQSKLANKIIFHAKDIPYMVSDVMMKDFYLLLDDLVDRKFFDVKTDSVEDQALRKVNHDITEYVKNGIFEFKTDPFWTVDLDYTHIDPKETKYNGAKIHEDFLNSNLVIFKGDLNYRKLVGDRTWDKTTSFKTALGDLGHNGIKLVSLRTCKADVQVGLPKGKDEELTTFWEKDHPGKGNWWVSSGKWAIISYNDGTKN